MPDIPQNEKELLEELKHLQRLVETLKETEKNNIRLLNALKDSEYRYRAVVEDQTELICRYLPDCTLTFVNDAYCRYYGKSQDELLGIKFTGMMTPDNAQAVRNHINRLTIQNPHVAYEELDTGPAGKGRWQQWVVRGLFNEKGELFEVQSVARDVTELKRIQKHLEEKNITLSEVLSRIEAEKRKIKDQFLENIRTLALPLVEKLEIEFFNQDRQYLKLLRRTLEELASSFGRNLKRKELDLTPREIEVCNMVKNGFTSKEIAVFLHITPKTVEKHRENIRRKLGIRSDKSNLSIYLRNLESDLSNEF